MRKKNINTKGKKSIEMKSFKKFNLVLHLLNILFLLSVSEEIPVSYCGSIKIQEPFFHQNSSHSSFLSQIILCKSEKLYFRTTIGLFQIYSINYNNKLITVSHTSCSSTSHFISPRHLSAGFPPLTTSNSLILFNCLNPSSDIPLFPCNNTVLSGVCALKSMIQKQESQAKRVSSCSVIDDVETLKKSFDPKRMDCTHYSRVYRSSSEKFELGTRISFDIPDHVPNPCNECDDPHGNCGVGLRCACHPKKCKDKVISAGAAVKLCGKKLAFFFVVIVFLHGFYV